MDRGLDEALQDFMARRKKQRMAGRADERLMAAAPIRQMYRLGLL